MKEAEPQFEQGLTERRKWAGRVAARHGVEVDEGCQHFVITFRDKDGNVTSKEFLPVSEKIKLETGKEKIGKDVPIDNAIEAVKQYPDLLFGEAVDKIESERVEQKEAGNGE